MKNPKTGLIIPCYNVEKTIEKVLSSLTPSILEVLTEIVCIDNRSADSTLQILKNIQAKGGSLGAKLTVLRNSQNYNLGGSMKIGFKYFIDRGFDQVVVIHSDNQGRPAEAIADFLNLRQKKPELDLILSSRFAPGSRLKGYGKIRIFANHFFNRLTQVMTGLRMSDAGAALMLVKTAVLKEVPFFDLTNGMHFNPQLNILIFGNEKFKIQEIPISWGESEAGTNVRVIKYGTDLLKMLTWVPIYKKLGRSGADLFKMTDRDFNPSFELISPTQ